MALNSHIFKTKPPFGRYGETVKRVFLLAVLLLIPLVSNGVQAQGTPIGVELECDIQTIEINVHPEQNEDVIVDCSVTNTGIFKESISLDKEVDGNDFSLEFSEDNFELEAGEDASFTARFSAQPRIEVTEVDYNIVAQIDSFGPEPIAIPIGALNSTDNVAGVIKSLAYSRIDLEVSDTSTRNIESGEELTISFTIFNDGNRIDELEVISVNYEELEDEGFTFISDSFFRASVNPGSSSDQGSIVLMTPSDLDSDLSVEIELRAFSKLDSSAEADVITIKIEVASSGSGGGSIGLDLETLDDDSMMMIGMGAGGLVLVILLLVLISRLSKKTGTKKTAAIQQRKAAKAARKQSKAARKQSKRGKKSKVEIEEDEEDDFDFDDLEDDDFDFDGL